MVYVRARVCVKLLYVKFVCEVIVCERWYVTKLCVWVCVKLLYVRFVCEVMVCDMCGGSYCMWEMVCDKVVCVWVCVCVKLLYVKFVCVKLLYVRDGMWQSCVCECVWSYGMWHVWRWRREAEQGTEETRDTESKTRTPHKVVGKKKSLSKSFSFIMVQVSGKESKSTKKALTNYKHVTLCHCLLHW